MAFNIFKKKTKKTSSKFPIIFSSNRIFSNSQKAITLAKSKKLGELKQGKIIYSPYEAIYLTENKKAEIIYKNKPITIQTFLKLLKKQEISLNYLVFKDLRKKGYIVKTGSKFGAEFRVYSRLKNSKNSLISTHAKWLVQTVKDSDKLNIKEFISKNRIAHTTGKKLLLAIIDFQEDIIYYEIAWLKP